MKITRVTTLRLELPLAEPYRIAYQHVDHAVNVVLRLETDRGLVGLGCAAPDPDVTRETPEDTLAAYEGPVRERLLGRDPLRLSRRLSELGPTLHARPAARAGVDLALHDLLGKAAGLPLWRLLGGYRDRIATSVTVGIHPLAETVERATKAVAQGFRAVKLKGGLDPAEDAERTLAVRRAVGRSVALRFDANQGYTPEQAEQFVHLTREARVEVLEQPTRRDDLAALGHVTRRVHLPVMADESLMDAVDAFQIARGELADTVNVKLMKTGGIRQAVHVDGIAIAAGLPVMVGCMDEATLGIAGSLAFALARKNVRWADLDGHFDLLDDPTTEAVKLRRGVLFPAKAPGLGLADLA